jgi:hypothetical protein
MTPRRTALSIDEQAHVALPKLYGQPAYARPPRPVSVTERPPNVDDLPISAFRTEEEERVAASIDGATYAERQSTGTPAAQLEGRGLQPRPFSLRTIGRLFGGNR